MGDYGSAAPWSDNGVKGCKRFLDRVADLTSMVKGGEPNAKVESAIHKTLKKVTLDIEDMKFNTAIAAMMGLLNDISDAGSITKDQLSIFVRMICPFAPHLAEEMWEQCGFAAKYGKMAMQMDWPKYDEAKTIDAVREMAVQVNGKLKGTIMLPMGCDKDTAIATAKADERVAAAIEGKTIIKEISVPNKIVNIVVK